MSTMYGWHRRNKCYRLSAQTQRKLNDSLLSCRCGNAAKRRSAEAAIRCRKCRSIRQIEYFRSEFRVCLFGNRVCFTNAISRSR
jgi:hypothetical protein